MQAHEDRGESGNAVDTRVWRSVEIDVSDTPPSLNRMGSRGHWRTVHGKKKAWQNDLGMLLLAAGLPKGLRRVEASAILRFRQQRRRDEGNFRAILEKALGDALVSGGWLTDDTPEHYSFGGLEFDQQRGPARTLVTIHYTKGDT